LNPHALAGTSPSSDRAPCGPVWRDEVSRGQVLSPRCVRGASLGLVRGDFAGLVSNGVSTDRTFDLLNLFPSLWPFSTGPSVFPTPTLTRG
jgi:hypothetical protein